MKIYDGFFRAPTHPVYAAIDYRPPAPPSIFLCDDQIYQYDRKTSGLVYETVLVPMPSQSVAQLALETMDHD